MAEVEHAREGDRSVVARSAAVRRRGASDESHELLNIQRLAGNAAVGSLVAQRQDAEDIYGSTGTGGGGPIVNLSSVTLRKQGTIQVSLSGSTVTDAKAEMGT